MKYILLFLMIFTRMSLFSQSDSTFPLSVKLELRKEHVEHLPKSYFKYEIEKKQLEVTGDWLNETQYDVAITLINNSTQPIFFWIMTCSWENNFMVNNDYIFIEPKDCDQNFAVLTKLAPGKSKVFKTTLHKSIKFENPCKNCIYGAQVEATKLGFILIDDLFNPKTRGSYGYDLAMTDKSLRQIIWSNPLYLLTENEAHPKVLEPQGGSNETR